MMVLHHRHWMNLYESGAVSRPAMMYISTFGERSSQLSYQMKVLLKRDASESRFFT